MNEIYFLIICSLSYFVINGAFLMWFFHVRHCGMSFFDGFFGFAVLPCSAALIVYSLIKVKVFWGGVV